MSKPTTFSNLKVRPFDKVGEIGTKVDKVRWAAAEGPIPVEVRKDLIRNIYYSFIDHKQLLLDALRKDLHRSASETQLLEISGILAEIKTALNNIDEWVQAEAVDFDIKQFAARPKLVKEPFGVVLVIGPWNYPLLCVAAPVINAIAAGNRVVAKPSEMVPHASEALMQVLEHALPPQYFGVVTGGIEETTELLKQQFDKICFTGSSNVGKVVSRAAAEHLTPCLLELGGKSPVVIDKTANIELAAKRIAWGKFMNAGQTCIAPDYILVEEQVKDKLVQELKAAVKRSYPNLTKDSTDFSHIVSDRLWERADSLVKNTKGKVELSWGKPDRESLFFPPTIISGVTLDDPLMDEELFGPLLPIISVRDAHEVVPLIKTHDTPLAFYIFSNNKELVEKLSVIRTGGLLVNDTLLHGASAVIPFGGVGNSGSGAYHGKFGFDAFTHKKPVLNQPALIEKLMSVRYPPFNTGKQAKIAKTTIPLGVWWPREGIVQKSLIRRLSAKTWLVLFLLATYVYKPKL